MNDAPRQTTVPTRAWRMAPDVTVPLDRAVLMAVLNATPDSFSDGGRHLDPAAAAAAAVRLVSDGAGILDVGGESTRPGAEPVSERDQITRVVPVIRAIREAGLAVPITIDTTRAAVAAAALDAGATCINDQSGGTDDPAMLPLAAERLVGIVLMHRTERPQASTYSTAYAEQPSFKGGVVESVRDGLSSLAQRAIEAGVVPDAIAVDPGLGFGKSVEQNLALMDAGAATAPIIGDARPPVLMGASRKSFVGRLMLGPGHAGDAGGVPEPADRDAASAACAVWMHARGVRLFRVHNARVHADALRTIEALSSASDTASRANAGPE